MLLRRGLNDVLNDSVPVHIQDDLVEDLPIAQPHVVTGESAVAELDLPLIPVDHTDVSRDRRLERLHDGLGIGGL